MGGSVQILTKSPYDRGDRSAVVNLQSLAPGDFQPPGIQPQLLQDGGMNVGDVVTVFDRMEPDFIGGPVHDAAFDAAARHPHAKSVNMVIAPVRPLRPRSPAEFSSKYNQRFVEQPAATEVLQQGGHRLVDRASQRFVIGF